MKRFRKLLFVALLFTVLIGSEAIAAVLTCTTQIEVPALTLNVSSAALNDIGINCTGEDSTTTSFAMLLTAPLVNVPTIQVFNGSASTPTATVQGQMAEGYDSKAVIFPNVSLGTGAYRMQIKDLQVDVQGLNQGDDIVERLFCEDLKPDSLLYQSPSILNSIVVSDTNTCTSFAGILPDNSVYISVRKINIGGVYVDALFISRDGSNNFNLTAANQVSPGNCTNAATVMIGQNEDTTIHVKNVQYNKNAYEVNLKLKQSDNSVAVIDAAPLPKAGFIVGPKSFTITHSWSAPYDTSCPQSIGTLSIINIGNIFSELYYKVYLLPEVSWINISNLITGSTVYGILDGGEFDDFPLTFNCKVSGPGTYTVTLTIVAWDGFTGEAFPLVEIPVTVEVGP